MTFAVFQDFPGLEKGPPKFHDFPGPMRTLGKTTADIKWVRIVLAALLGVGHHGTTWLPIDAVTLKM